MTAMTPDDIANLGILDPDRLREMGEPPSSVNFLTQRREPTLLEMFGNALRPLPNYPRVDTGD